jgi:hypothetical protein
MLIGIAACHTLHGAHDRTTSKASIRWDLVKVARTEASDDLTWEEFVAVRQAFMKLRVPAARNVRTLLLLCEEPYSPTRRRALLALSEMASQRSDLFRKTGCAAETLRIVESMAKTEADDEVRRCAQDTMAVLHEAAYGIHGQSSSKKAQ